MDELVGMEAHRDDGPLFFATKKKPQPHLKSWLYHQFFFGYPILV